jgi:hypothetical protein
MCQTCFQCMIFMCKIYKLMNEQTNIILIVCCMIILWCKIFDGNFPVLFMTFFTNFPYHDLVMEIIWNLFTRKVSWNNDLQLFEFFQSFAKMQNTPRFFALYLNTRCMENLFVNWRSCPLIKCKLFAICIKKPFMLYAMDGLLLMSLS